MDMFDCGIYSFVNTITVETIRYFAKNSFQHIDVLFSQTQTSEVTLYDNLNNELKKLYKSFKMIYYDLEKVNSDTNIYFTLKKFLKTNDKFVILLERLKFEGYNGHPALYQVIYHVLYEQMYIKEIFRPLMYTRDIQPKNVVINSEFRKMSLGTNPIDCIYGQLYFWSLIGAEHPSIIMNISIDETNQLPMKTINKLKNTTKRFNNINYNLSEIYPKLNSDNLSSILYKFVELNNEFITLLNELAINSQYMPINMKIHLPKLFFNLLEHITYEHIYAKDLMNKIIKSQY